MPSRNPPWARDELILSLDLYFQANPVQLSPRSDEVQRLSETLNRLPLYLNRADAVRFRNPNGVYMKLCNFLQFDPNYQGVGLTHGGKLDKAIWDEFYDDRHRLRSLAQGIQAFAVAQEHGTASFKADVVDEEFQASEGLVLSRVHSVRERNRSLVRKKKSQALRRSGKLKCEACEFAYPDKYGSLGDGFIECHHVIPLSQLRPGQATKLADLALVCANCHRMLHRDGETLSIEKLQNVVHSTKGRLLEGIH